MNAATVSIIEFDFEKRVDRPVSLERLPEALRDGKYLWIDIDASHRQAAEEKLRSMGINEVAISEALGNKKLGRYDPHEDCLHVTVTAPVIEEGSLRFSHVDLILGERFICSFHKGEVEFIKRSKNNYQKFFTYAKSLGFLLFEFWDYLIDSYRRVFAMLEDDVERLQGSIFKKVDDQIFGQVAGLSNQLIVMRRNILGNREVLHQMVIHKSAYVSETTQPFLANMVGTFERLSGDLTVEREILEETLNLYLGIVSHKTNRVVNRLTILSLIFLPLTFLCGIYGMNFEFLPEFKWQYGYVYFWSLVVFIVSGLLVLMKIKRWL
jgi:magnesium transporter